MDKNTLLNIASGLCTISRVILVISILATTVFLIHFLIDTSAYSDIKVTIPESSSNLKIEFEDIVGEAPVNTNVFTIDDWNTGSMIFTYFQIIGILTLLYLSIGEFAKVLRSVRKLKTFQITNEQAFRKIGFYCIFLAILTTITYWQFGNYSLSRFSISFNALGFALFAFILSEIFKEGNTLKTENDLTI